MKNFLLLACVFIIFFTACSKEDKGCTPVKPEAEEAEILAFATANGIDSIKRTNGIYYSVIDSGYGARPSVNSMVTVTYTGKLLNGAIFEKVPTAVEWKLSGLIEGWQIGIPLIKKGGKIKLVIPSVYAYGCNGKKDINIPANAVLYYEVNLISVR
ncbi:MAG: FKBP-type peptidylprolyl isomerase [Segetibacter sp.]|nr:FKBP-type peptidylprolyl isomerase [Segetibacter sp.]